MPPVMAAFLLSFGVIFVAELGDKSQLMALAALCLAELGDKTLLATITLATTNGVIGTWAGSTVGMVAADALAIGVGKALGSRLPERVIRIGAAALFVVFGVALVVEAARG